MSVLVDTSVLIDHLRGDERALHALERHRAYGPLHSSESVRLEILAGMRPAEEAATRILLDSLIWHPVDTGITEDAGALGRRWLPSHNTIDSADLAIAATALQLGLPLLTTNIRHFPMFDQLRAPY